MMPAPCHDAPASASRRQCGAAVIAALAVLPALFCLPAGSARAGDSDQSLLLRQSDGSYVGVDVGGHAPYEVEKPYPGANWSAVYDNRGNRVGTIEDQPGGPVFYDNRGNRR